MSLKGLAERGSNAGTVPKTKEPCVHALVFTELEDEALRWLDELFKAMSTHQGVSSRYGEAAREAIVKLYAHAETQHAYIHHLEEEADTMIGILNDLSTGRAFIASRGEA